ncbi:MAG: ABC transporter substrate-binding protein [Coriobacteriales bacterium]|jgi:putative spermidine/putrescine transport system substrate-binding protein|nr:ABC transporter substrate-binding protein [Coriobacteriales bacterium]
MTEASSTSTNSMTRRNFIALSTVAGAGLLLGGVLTGCGGTGTGGSVNPATPDIDYNDWNAVLESVKGQTVAWFGWGGSQPRNQWLETVLIPALKERYDLTLQLVPMGAPEFLTQLSGEIQAGAEEGSIDFMWINGENFFSAKDNGYLWGPFTDYLPNFKQYVDADSPEIKFDFGSPTQGYEAPYGKTQMQMWVDSAIVKTTPKNPVEFLEFCKANPGKVTYPEPGDFTGTAFISCLIAGVIGKAEFEKLSSFSKEQATSEAVKAIVEPGLEYLRSLNPHLWKQGTTFPADSPTVGILYADGELLLNMGYGAPQALVDDGSLPKTTRSFVFDTGTTGNTNFMAIATNAPHKAAAMVAINEVISPEMQLSQLEMLGNLTVLDISKLDAAAQEAFNSVPLGETQLPLDDLLAHRVAEASGPVVPVLEALWHSDVVGK